MVFGTGYDAPLKLAAKLGKPVDQALDMTEQTEQWTEIEETLTQRKPATINVDGDADETADVTMMTSGDPLADGPLESLNFLSARRPYD